VDGWMDGVEEKVAKAARCISPESAVTKLILLLAHMVQNFQYKGLPNYSQNKLEFLIIFQIPHFIIQMSDTKVKHWPQTHEIYFNPQGRRRTFLFIWKYSVKQNCMIDSNSTF
jgi:hypothetical protein